VWDIQTGEHDRLKPHVTSIIRNQIKTPYHYNDWYAERGTAVHKAINLLVQSRLDWNTVDPRIINRVKAFELFLSQTNMKVLYSELSLGSRKYQFKGTMDLVLKNGKDLIIADIKSTIEPIADLQIVAYKILWEENRKTKINKCCAIQLQDDGFYKLRWVDDLKRAERIFLAFLAVDNWKKEFLKEPMAQEGNNE
jgi:hypothetical protein